MKSEYLRYTERQIKQTSVEKKETKTNSTEDFPCEQQRQTNVNKFLG